MRYCYISGCNIVFTVSGPGITTVDITSVWWFTDAAVLPSSSGTSGFSSDDGMWGAGPGEVNGNAQCYGGSNTVTPQKGASSTKDPVGPKRARVSRRGFTRKAANHRFQHHLGPGPATMIPAALLPAAAFCSGSSGSYHRVCPCT
eukprot:scaffold144567_cov57-Phaeocystis_antarctica.AAC.1